MRNKTVTDMHIDELLDYDWLSYEDKDGEEIVIRSEEDEKEAAKVWKTSPLAVKAMRQALDLMTMVFVDEIKNDLQDIWNTANCAHDNALTAMAILNAEDCDEDTNEPIEPNEENCRDCEWWDGSTKTCKQPPDAD